MTLEGFMARPNDKIDWAFKYALIGEGIRLFDNLKAEDIELREINPQPFCNHLFCLFHLF